MPPTPEGQPLHFSPNGSLAPERYAELLLQSTGEGVYGLDAEGRCTFFNRAAEALTGWSAADMLGKDLHAILHHHRPDGSFYPKDECLILAGYRSGKPCRGSEEVFWRKDGTPFPVEFSANPLVENGAVLGAVVLFADITERQRAERERQKSEARRAAVMASALDAILTIDHAGRITEWNPAAERIFGWAREEMLGQELAETIIPPGLREQHRRGFARYLATGEAAILDRRIEITGRRADGSEFPLELTVTRIAGEGPPAFTGFIRDLTERKRAEEELRLIQERMSLAVGAAELGTFYCPLPFGEMVWNAKCKEHFWLPPDAVVDIDLFFTRVHPEDRARVRGALERAVSDHAAYDVEYRTVDPANAGRLRWVRALGRAFYDEAGQPMRFDGITGDVTPRRLAAEAAAAQERQLLRLTRKLEFLNGLSEATRGLSDPEQVMATVARRLGEHLQVSRAAYADVEPDGENFTIRQDFTAEGCATSVGRYALSRFGPRAAADQRGGRTLVIRDVDRELAGKGHGDGDGEGAGMFKAIGIRAIVCCPLVKNGQLAAMMAVHQTTPRDWSEEEIALVEAAVERSWADIERARADRAMVESEERFRSLVTATTLIIWRADREGAILDQVPGWEAFTGQTPAQHLGRGWFSAVHPEDREQVAAVLRRSREAREIVEAVFRLRRRDGEFRRVLCIGVPLRDARGEVREWIGTCTEVEEKLRLDEQREELLTAERAAREEAERTGRMKDEFLATLSHELRTPLNAILGWTQLLRGGGVPREEISEGLEVIERNARVQTQLIEDLLDMSRIISGKVRLDVRHTDPAAVVRAAVESVTPAADAREIRLQPVLDPHAGPVMGDPARLQQVVWNLLANAIKFTPKRGRVQVSVERVNSHVEISVRDTGAGIAPDFLPHVFERFRQADASTTRQHGGLGLGLAIVKNLVEMHGGRVWAKSPGPDRGATFTVHLPLAIVHPPENPSPGGRQHPRVGAGDAPPLTSDEDAPDLHGAKVLVVDDEPDGRALVQRMLERSRARVTTAASAAEGLSLLPDLRPDLLISDVGMPGEDGYGFLKAVRALSPEQGGTVPAVALTAFARSEDRRRAMLAGFDMHVAKPVDAAELLAVVARLTGRR